MKLAQEQVAFIERHINEDLIDKQILIEYLEKHRLIKNDVFKRYSKAARLDRSLFKKWCDYLHICKQLSWTDYTPERFITKYNYALEAAGRDPIIYEPVRQLGGTYFVICNHEISCRGHFPCDDNGTPILRWTNIKIRNAKSVSFFSNLYHSGNSDRRTIDIRNPSPVARRAILDFIYRLSD